MDDFMEDYLDDSEDEEYDKSYLLNTDSEEDDLDESIFLPKETSIESDHDEFEKEMAEELSQTMKSLTVPLLGNTSSTDLSSKPTSSKKVTFNNDDGTQFYDKIYFDSDASSEDDAEPSGKNKRKKLNKKRRILSNDELFYDPNMDDEDQDWVDRKRSKYQVKPKRSSVNKSDPNKTLPQTDAVLNCPACLTTLCRDSQRHAIYQNQYRAMFVFNCKIDYSEKLKFPKKGKKNFMKEKRKAKQLRKKLQEEEIPIKNENKITEELEQTEIEGTNLLSGSETIDNEEMFHPVHCEICKTKIAVYDKDEVYHFFNVVTSY